MAYFEVTWQEKRGGRPVVHDEPLGRHDHVTLLLRSSAEGSGDLLLRSLGGDEFAYRHVVLTSENSESGYEPPPPETVCVTVFRYSPGARQLDTLGPEEWEAATGEICECHGQNSNEALSPFERGPLRFNEQPTALAGGVFERASGLTALPYVAVVSADGGGPRQVGTWGVWRDSIPRGPYYQQVFSKTDGRPVGETVRLPFNRDTCLAEGPCWSSDGKFIVYASCYGAEELWIVQTGLSEGTQ